MSSYKPLGTRVLILEDAAMDKTEGGLIIPDSVKQRRNTGVIKAVGEKCAVVKVDDKVLYPKDTGTEIEVDKIKLLIMFEETIDLVL